MSKELRKNISKLTKDLIKVSNMCEAYKNSIIRRKHQQRIDANFKNYIKEKYPKIYNEVVKAQLNKGNHK